MKSFQDHQNSVMFGSGREAFCKRDPMRTKDSQFEILLEPSSRKAGFCVKSQQTLPAIVVVCACKCVSVCVFVSLCVEVSVCVCVCCVCVLKKFCVPVCLLRHLTIKSG